MDLQALDKQLKGAIQSHQMLVAKMKSDPQNGSLQKQLHELQSQIKALSERQKQVVQQLRMDLGVKRQQPTSIVTNSISSSGLPKHTQSIIRSLPQTIPLSLTTKQVEIRPSKSITVSASILLPNKVHITNSLINSNCSEPSRTPLAPVGASLSANSKNGTVTLQTADSSSESTTLTPPIRVPQYPPPHSRPSSLLHLNHQKPPPSLYSVNAQISPLSLTSNSPSDGSKSPLQSHAPWPKPSSEDVLPNDEVKFKALDDGTLKKTFMKAIGLITHDMLTELQSRRSERKRRTTANPQFSYGNWENHDKKCNRSNYLSGTLPSGFKRPRGRPRIGSTTPNGSRPTSPEDGFENGSVLGFSGVHVLRNGILMTDSKVCIVCQENGDLLSCEVCLLSYHQNCLDPVTTNKEETTSLSRWICPKCLSGDQKSQHMPRSLAIVHSYIMHKTAKEEEKRKLLKRGIELKVEQNHLERKAKQLTEALSLQVQKRSNLMSNTKEMIESIEQLKLLVTTLQTS